MPHPDDRRIAVPSLRALASRLVDGLLRRQRDARLDEEIETHLDALRDDFVARGYAPGDADAAARRAFGGVDQMKARYRDQRGWPWIDAVIQDLRFAVRHLVRDRAFATPVVLVLALGLGVGHMFFTLTYAHVLRGLPMDAVERVLAVSSVDASGTVRGVSYADFADLRAAQRSFADLAAYTNAAVTIGDDDQVPDRLDAASLTASAFSAARVAPILGRVLRPEDEVPGAAPVVVVTERVWRGRYAGSADVAGHPVRLNGAPATIVGVVSDRSGLPTGAALFVPLTASTAARDARTLGVFGRLAEGVAIADASAELAAVAATLARQFPATNDGVRVVVEPINYRLLGGAATVRGWLPFITAGLIVLAVASTNVGNLLLAGAASRAREVAVRTALGASRGRIARQLLVESVVIAAAASALGLALSRAGVALYRGWIPDGLLPYWFDYSLNPALVAALGALALATLVVFAVVPAVLASRTAVVAVLKDGGRGDTGRRGAALGGSIFLGAQLGLAIVLAAQVGVATVTRDEPLATDPALDDARVLTGTLTLPAADDASLEARRDLAGRVIDRLTALPGISHVALASHGPVGGASERQLVVDGAAAAAAPVHVVQVSPGYFDLLGLGVIRGRPFTPRDGLPGDAAVIVNARLAALHFGSVDPVGRRLALPTSNAPAAPDWLTVVGVVPDVRQRPGAPAAIPIAYLPLIAAPPTTAVLMVRGTPDGVALAGPVREALRQIDDRVPLYRVLSLAAATREATWAARVSAQLALTVCLSSFALAVAGLYAVVSHRILRRRREIGVRIALGATPLRIARLAVGTVYGAVALGLVLGLAGVAAWDRAFAPTGPDARPLSATHLAAVVVVLLTTVILGGMLPARRAAGIAPAEVLRRE
jgi:putative ABC transport system permease protein